MRSCLFSTSFPLLFPLKMGEYAGPDKTPLESLSQIRFENMAVLDLVGMHRNQIWRFPSAPLKLLLCISVFCVVAKSSRGNFLRLCRQNGPNENHQLTLA